MAFIFHIVRKEDWRAAQKQGNYAPPTLKDNGFIHCSKPDQILNVAENLFKNDDNLLLLKIDTDKLTAELKDEVPVEAPYSEKTFPHIYGSLNLDAVVDELHFTKGDDGKFILPTLL